MILLWGEGDEMEEVECYYERVCDEIMILRGGKVFRILDVQFVGDPQHTLRWRLPSVFVPLVFYTGLLPLTFREVEALVGFWGVEYIYNVNLVNFYHRFSCEEPVNWRGYMRCETSVFWIYLINSILMRRFYVIFAGKSERPRLELMRPCENYWAMIDFLEGRGRGEEEERYFYDMLKGWGRVMGWEEGGEE